MFELLNDNCCLTCEFAEPKGEDKYGNPEYIKCKLTNEDMPIDEICEKFA